MPDGTIGFLDRRDDVLCALEAEHAVIGILLMENEAIHSLDRLRPEHFSEPFHGKLFQAISETIGKGRAAEPIGMAQRLAGDRAFEDLGGQRFLADLLDAAPTTNMAEHFARIIVEAAQKRALLRLAGDIQTAAKSGESEASDIIGLTEASLLSMQATTRALTLVSAGAAAAKVLEHIDAPPEEVHGVLTGLAPIDDHLGPMLPGDLILGMGRPSMGKSAWAASVAVNIAQAGQGVIEINGEMSDIEMAQRHLSDLCHARWGARGPKYSDMRRRAVTLDQRRMLDGARDVMDHLPLMMLKRPGLKLSQVRSIARRQAAAWARKGVPLGTVIIDHAGLVKPDRSNNDRYADQTIISNGLKELADELQCPLIVLNQMNRQNEHREDKRPQLSDLRDSGSWEQDADFVIGFYREAYYAQRQPEPKKELDLAEWLRARNSRKVEAIILKARAGECKTIDLWADVARNAIRGAVPEDGDLI
jgi:replicative DNA helicase